MSNTDKNQATLSDIRHDLVRANKLLIGAFKKLKELEENYKLQK